ncbi:MAG: gamma carbonic anhydrase family protein [Alphaproteobacteria bacterium HGW-Alphaproteobacteria-6]|nr:MAG: gamma carbonic anhydrase family protein [Alphaproteobacteria bacterium HGW-Alphaproteobacteria-6]
MIYALDGREPVIGRDVWIAPGAHVIGDVVLEDEAGIWFGAVLRGDNEVIRVGRGTNIQENCVLHTDIGFPLMIGADCTIGHKAMLHGCQVGDGSLVGMGAAVLNGAVIGQGCLIGAGALVTEGKVIPDGSLVTGAPGRVVRSLDGAARAGLLASAEGYRAKAARYRAGLRAL